MGDAFELLSLCSSDFEEEFLERQKLYPIRRNPWRCCQLNTTRS